LFFFKIRAEKAESFSFFSRSSPKARAISSILDSLSRPDSSAMFSNFSAISEPTSFCNYALLAFISAFNSACPFFVLRSAPATFSFSFNFSIFIFDKSSFSLGSIFLSSFCSAICSFFLAFITGLKILNTAVLFSLVNFHFFL
jgi:hypothetical protein